MKRTITFFTLLLMFCINAFAQETELSPDEMESYKARCVEYINAFQKGLATIADKGNSQKVKDHQKKVVLSFFMGKGEPYVDVDGKEYPAVKMEVSVARYGKVVDKNIKSLKQYLEDLQNLPYVSVKMTQAHTCVVSNLYPVPGAKDRYQATVSFFQYFEGAKGDGRFYRDRTQKDVQVFLTKVTDGNLGTFWDLKFGDINVVETIRL